MAKLSKWSIFFRGFLLALFAAQPSKVMPDGHTDDEAWQSALEANTPQAFFEYLSKYPAGSHVTDAVESLKRSGAIESPPAARSIGNGGGNQSGGQTGGGQGPY